MSNYNFKCPKTGKKFFISSHKSILNESTREWTYKDRFGVLVNPDNKIPLVPIEREGPLELPMIMKSTSDRIVRNEKHFKKRAKDHAKSEEGVYNKKKNLKREIDTVSGKNK